MGVAFQNSRPKLTTVPRLKMTVLYVARLGIPSPQRKNSATVPLRAVPECPDD